MAQAVQINVMSSAATKAAYLELVPQFEGASGHTVITQWVPSVQMMNRLTGDGTADLVIMASRLIDELIEAGKVVRGSRVDLARSGVGVAVRAGARKPDIGSLDAFRQALLDAKSIAYSTGPSGIYLVDLFERMGIAAELKPKIRQVQGEMVGDVVARGDAEIGFQQVSELLPIAGISFLGSLPAEIQQVTVFAAALAVNARQPDAARALIGFMRSPPAMVVFKRTGMEPA